MKYFPSKKTLPLGIFKIGDTDDTLKQLLPDIVEVSITIEDYRLRSNSNILRTVFFNEKSSFCTVLEFFKSHSGPLNNIEGIIHLVSGDYKSKKPNNITGVDEIPLKCDYHQRIYC